MSLQVKRLRIVLMAIMWMQIIAFIGPRIYSQLDRWGYGTIKLSYGLIATDALFVVVLIMHLFLIILTWMSIQTSSTKLMKYKVNFRNSMLGIVFIFPIFIYGADSGYFWTVPLLYASLFLIIPNIVHSKFRIVLMIMLAIIFALSGSKAGIVYIMIIGYIFWPEKINIKIIILTLFIFLSMLLLTIYVRNEWSDLAIMPYYILWREYCMEMTGLAIKYNNDGSSLPYSVIWSSLMSLIPASLVDVKIQVTHTVPALIAEPDVAMVPDAGFYLSYFLLFILDMGLLGIPIAYFMYWKLLRVCVDKLAKSNGVSYCLPFLVYLHYLINGELAFYLSHAIFGSMAIFLAKCYVGQTMSQPTNCC